MKSIRIILPAVFSLMALHASATTISENLAQIARNNLSLKASAAEAEAVVAEIRSDNSLPATSIEYSPFFQSCVTGVASSELVVSQEFEFPSIYAQRAKSARLEREAQLRQQDAERQQLLLDSKQLMLDYILITKNNEILERRRTSTGALLKAYSKLDSLGRASILEVNKVRLELEELQREKMQNDAETERIAGALDLLNGGMPLDLTGIDYEFNASSSSDLAANIPSDINALIASNTDIAAAEARAKAASQEVTVSKNGWLPSISLGYRRNTELSEATNGMLVGASFPLFSAGKKVKAAKAKLAASRLQAENSVAEARAKAEAQMRELQITAATLRSYDLNLLNETLALYRKSLDAGQMTLTEYYTETDLLYTRLQTRAQLENTLHKQLAELNRSRL